MSLRDKIGEYVPMLARKPVMPREQSLSLRPRRNPAVTWAPKPIENEDSAGGMALTVPLRRVGIGKVFTRLLSLPNTRQVELDEFGGELWTLCDGGHTVEQFVQHTSRKYQLNRRQAEVSVLAFLRMLMERRLVGFTAQDLKGNEHVSTDTVRPLRRKRRPTGSARRRH